VEEDDTGMTEPEVERVLRNGYYCEGHLIPLEPDARCGICKGGPWKGTWQPDVSLMQYLLLKGIDKFPKIGFSVEQIRAKLRSTYRAIETGEYLDLL
jgi:hypothetical protein